MHLEKCSVEGCNGAKSSRGLCQSHYRRWMKYGRLDRIRHVNEGKKCSHDGCNFTATAKGFCRHHYKAIARQNPKIARANKQYSLWHDRKSRGLLCDEWDSDFFAFIKAVGECPSKRHALVRKNKGLYGPNNFEWREHLRRQPGESKKDWFARKWQTRMSANPGWDRRRGLVKKYGITDEQYDELHKQQNGLCAICQTRETKLDTKTSQSIRLSVDHCHKTKKVRGLLCWRCNVTIGKISESIELLHAMEAYLLRNLNQTKEDCHERA